MFISSDANFDYSISQTVDIEYTGEYIAAVDYRGTNTTGVEVELFMDVEDESGVIHIQATFSRMISGL